MPSAMVIFPRGISQPKKGKIMRNRPFRRANLISPFGPGAISVSPDGTATITTGLDHWFKNSPGFENQPLDVSEFEFHEWRLEHELGVGHLRVPPDYRQKKRGFSRADQPDTNIELQVPMLRFPQWHVCSNLRCQSLKQFPLSMQEEPKCAVCAKDNRWPYPMIQVQFIAICEDGHVQDFPWREWVHRSCRPTCQGRMRFRSRGGATLDSRVIHCECGKKRNMSRIMEGKRQTNESIEVPQSQTLLTYLSENLAEGGEPFLCRGTRPWLGEEQGDGCPKPLHGTLRGATNVYFPIVKSAIYLPRPGDSAPPKLRELLDTEEVQRLVRVTMKLNPSIPALCSILREEFPSIEASGYSDESIEAAVTAKFDEPSEDGSNVTDDDPETSFRRAEYDLLRSGYQSPDLIVRTAKVSEYLPPVQDYFSRIQLVQKLRETRAFTGFSRLKSKDHLDWDARNLQLWRCKRARKSNWLPAYTVYGEGLYFELDENHLSAWEQHAEVISRISPLNLHYEALQRQRAYRELAITPRFALLHTLAHL